jgi:hypothetical protein
MNKEEFLQAYNRDIEILEIGHKVSVVFKYGKSTPALVPYESISKR